ncbi:hypothetical protein ACFFX1_47150 [Dactylosporangium sucinum]|uniref:Uncharacterized protein n=1 Tax=Dactylosporangium sucinum TaxID=1424081 RepID=A0A917UCW4_9ACTN|nr:hypothetical protein [Dactylosporangium sucinum]GGM75761.1 hypothetical protein GCM10007977_091590 [Dactylosporangium sucinum]
MTEGRHQRRHDDGHTEDGIYVPPPREVPRPRSERTGPPGQPTHPVAPSPWAPTASNAPATPAAPSRPEQGTHHPPTLAEPHEAHPIEAPVYYARASEWTARPSPWATPDRDDDAFEDEEFAIAPAEVMPPPPPAQIPEHLPRQRVPAPKQRASATAWWVAVGVIIVALAVAAGVLVGLRLAAQHAATGAEGEAAVRDPARPVLVFAIG